MSDRVNINTRPTYAYRLCGWHTHSDIPLTNVPTSGRGAERTNILIKTASGNFPMGKTVDGSDGSHFQHSTERSLIRIKNVADFEVSKGKKILVWPSSKATKKDIELFLFGPVWATLCHQRGILPLHASAIATRRGIAAFAGNSGAGKSTIGAFMGTLGYELVTDDILPVSCGQNSEPGAWPYLRRLKLQGDAIMQFALTPAEPVSDALDEGKYFVLPKFAADDKWSRLERLYLLDIEPTVSRVSIDRMTGFDAVRILIDHTYHSHFVVGSGRLADHLMICARLASTIPIYRLRRSPTVGSSEDLGRLIHSHLNEAT